MSRQAKLELSIRKDGKREKIELGGVFTGKFEGNYGVALTLPLLDEAGNPVLETGKNGNEYPARDKIIAVKTESGRKLNISEAFVNLIVYEALAARGEWTEGPSAPAPAKAPAKEEEEDF